MNNGDIPPGLNLTINECPRRFADPCLAHSKGEPDVSPMRININVRFAAPVRLPFHIRVVENGLGV
jgi:hypothetical protein